MNGMSFLVVRHLTKYGHCPMSRVAQKIFHTFSRIKGSDNHSSIITKPYSFQQLSCPIFLCNVQKRCKYKKTKQEEESDTEDEEEVNDLKDGSKLVVGHMTSLRTDAVLKAGLGMARNKVEVAFYESRIRVNGRKIPKKSFKVGLKDEVDVIRGENRMNEAMLDISRVVVVSARHKEDDEKLTVKMRRYKNLTVEEYQEPWKNKSQ